MQSLPRVQADFMSRLKVLIADSTASVRQFIRYGLEDHFRHLAFEVATNGKNIKKRLEENPFDLILYEREMPLLSGDEFLIWIKNHENLKSVPIIILSADRGEESLKKAVKLGANAYLIKPLLVNHLINKVKQIMARSDDNKNDRRKTERINIDGIVYLTWSDQTCRGEVVNISAGGLLASFNGNEDLPRPLDGVSITLDLERKQSISNIPAQVMRIHAVDTEGSCQDVQVAFKFDGTVSPEMKKEYYEFFFNLRPTIAK